MRLSYTTGGAFNKGGLSQSVTFLRSPLTACFHNYRHTQHRLTRLWTPAHRFNRHRCFNREPCVTASQARAAANNMVWQHPVCNCGTNDLRVTVRAFHGQHGATAPDK